MSFVIIIKHSFFYIKQLDSELRALLLMAWSHLTTDELPMSFRLVTDAKSPMPGRAPALRHYGRRPAPGGF